MPYPTTSQITDPVTTLNLKQYRGNVLRLALNMPVGYLMPQSVTAVFYYGRGGRTLEVALQPEVYTEGQTIYLVAQTEKLPDVGYHLIRFDGRTVLAGPVLIGYQTSGAPDLDDLTLDIVIDETVPVTVQVLVGTSGGGGAGNAPDFLNVYQLFKQA